MIDEKFIIIKIAKIHSKKKNQDYYYIVCYSQTYDFNMRLFVSEKIFNCLKANINFLVTVDINSYLEKRYNHETEKFEYFLNSSDSFYNYVSKLNSDLTVNKK